MTVVGADRAGDGWVALVLRDGRRAEGVVVADLEALEAAVPDAAVAAWSARRVHLGRARSLPDPPERAGGRTVAILA